MPSRGWRLFSAPSPPCADRLSRLGERLAANPNDKLLPSPAQMATAFLAARLRAGPALRRHYILLGRHLRQPAQAVCSASASATLAALCFGIAIGFIPRVRALLAPFVRGRSRVIPPMALLPILFIVFGLGETVEGHR